MNFVGRTNPASYGSMIKLEQTCHPFLRWKTSQKPWTFSLKANIVKDRWPSNASSRALDGFESGYDSSLVRQMRPFEEHFIGQTVCDEFGCGSYGVNHFFDIARNPYDPERSCGGSSGGSACAAAAIPNHLAFGSSTGGSVVVPAAFCGVYGFCPTYGLISRFGLIDYCSSFDKIGMCSARFDLIYQSFDQCTQPDPRDMTKRKMIRRTETSKQRLLYLRHANETTEEELIRERFYQNFSHFDIIEESFPFVEEALQAYMIIVFNELSSNLDRYGSLTFGTHDPDPNLTYHQNLARFRGERITPEVLKRIVYGDALRMINHETHYNEKARAIVRKVRAQYDAYLETADFIACATTPTIAPRFDEVTQMTQLQKMRDILLSVSPNLFGYPHMSVPLGLYEGMPVGGMFIGQPLHDQRLLDVGMEIYNAHPQSPERW